MVRLWLRLAAVLVLSLVSTLGPRSVFAAPADYDLPSGGHFYSQAGNGVDLGYTVTDADGIGFWALYQQLGGPESMGFPMSQRFQFANKTVQVFQRGAMQVANPDSEASTSIKVEVMPVLDMLSQQGLDDWLETKAVPRPFAPDSIPLPPNPSLEQRVTARQAFLYEREALKSVYFGADDPLARWGMPMSRPVDEGTMWVVRTQTAILQEWKVPMPWADAGDVTVGLVGDLLKESKLVKDAKVWEAQASPEAPAPPKDGPQLGPGGNWQAMPGEHWIDVDLSRQRVFAMVGNQVIYSAPATTGKRGWATPTGSFAIQSRVFNETMDSATLGIPRNSSEGYYLPNIYFTQYFAAGGYAIHSNYWQPDSAFGNYPTSHGCVGLRYNDAKFFWDFGNYGTRINIHY